MKKKRILSGVQPSAAQVHLGNYLGAMRRFVTLEKTAETIFCVVDLHALTSIKNPKELLENTLSLTAAYLAIGLDPNKTILFRQSDVPEVCELTWYLACNFPYGLLERAHALKDAKAKEESINAGVVYYPILMAADILLYRATDIPVGADQKQHLEMARDIAGICNQRYGDVFPVPEPLIEKETGVIPGLDGRKMSKSYGNYIGLFESPKRMQKQIRRIVTDSKTVEEKKDPDSCTVFSLYKFFASVEEQEELSERYLAGGMGYGEAKDELFRVIHREVGPLHDRYQEFISRPDDLRDILGAGAKKARGIAGETINDVRNSNGIGVKL